MAAVAATIIDARNLAIPAQNRVFDRKKNPERADPTWTILKLITQTVLVCPAMQNPSREEALGFQCHALPTFTAPCIAELKNWAKRATDSAHRSICETARSGRS
jgi:hypothetical protein